MDVPSVDARSVEHTVRQVYPQERDFHLTYDPNVGTPTINFDLPGGTSCYTMLVLDATGTSYVYEDQKVATPGDGGATECTK